MQIKSRVISFESIFLISIVKLSYVTSLNSQNTHKQVCEFSKHGSTILNKPELGTLVRIDFLPCKGCISKICLLAFMDFIAFYTYVSTLTVGKTP